MVRQQNPFLRSGLPFLGLMLGGFAGLAFFLQGKFDIQDAKQKGVDERAPVIKQRAHKFNISDELERLKAAQKTAAENFENKPVPRPKDWEEYERVE